MSHGVPDRVSPKNGGDVCGANRATSRGALEREKMSQRVSVTPLDPRFGDARRV